MITEYKSALYRISYQGVSMIENALGNPNLIQISVVLGCSIIVSPQQGGGIQYLPNGESRKWFLYGVNTKLNKTDHHFIYARLNRDGDQAYLIFSVNDYAIDGTINGENPSPAYYYVKVGEITETDALEGATTQRKITFDFGKYQTDETREENYWQLRSDSQGNVYIITKYPVLTQGSLTQYATLDPVVPSIFEGIPYDNQTIWFNPATQRVEVIGGTGGGEAGSVKWVNITGKPTWIGDAKPTYNWSEIQGEKPFYTKEEIASKYVTIDTEQEITALKHFTAGLSVGESKKKIYEENGVVYIDADVAVTGAITFYASAGRSVSTIMDGVTVDEETITKGSDNVLRIKNAGAGSSFDENAMWSALSGSSDNQINKSHLTTALDGYATRNWVIENYATKSELSAVSNKLSDFLEGSDTDSIINKWKELEAFLSGMAETDNLAEILETKADKKYVDSTFVTLATKQTITGEKTFSSVLNTAAIKASGAITAPSLAASDWVTIAGIKLRKLEDGALMLEGNLALTGALTMYASNGQGFDTIYDGLPIDNDTIYWQEVDGSRVLKAREGSGSSFDKSAMWTALAGSTTEQINKSHLTTALTGYATESWVSGKNYAVKATTLAGYGITDGVNDVSVTGTGNAVTAASISGHTLTLTKGSTFSLSGHKHAWSDITSGKPTTLSGYGITDAYTMTESDNKYPTKTGSGASGTWGINVTGNAGTATKLQTARTLWGQSFNGQQNISGDLTGVGRLVSNGSLELSYKNDDTTSLTFTGTVFRPFTSAHNNIDLGASTVRWRDLYIGRNAYVDGITKTGDFYIGGIRLHKTADGVITLEGNLAVTGGITTYAIDPVSASTIMDGVVVDGTTIKKENGKLVAVGGGEAGSVQWGNISGKPSVFATNIANITDLHANWDALLKAAPSAYVTRWPSFAEVTSKPSTLSGYGITDAPTKTGSGASGTWSIGITGNAATASKWATARTITLGSYLSGSVSLDGSANVTLNANVVGLTSQGNKTAISGTTMPAAGVRLYQVYNNGYPVSFGNLLSIKGGGCGELLLAWKNTNRIYYRSRSDVHTETWQSWSTVAFLTDNVASATKLQTARTLWGQNFNGTQNVSGNMSNVGKISANGEIITSSANSFRAAYGGYGFFIRNDGVSTYFMHTNKDDPYGGWNNNRPITIDNASGRISINSALDVGSVTTFYNKVTGTSISCSDWHRSTGQTGWANDSYGGGIYMTDATWVRVWNGKGFLCENTIESSYKLSARQLVNVYGALGYGWGSGQAAFQVAIPTNENQTPILLAYNGVNGNQTGNDRYFAIEVLNTGLRNVHFNVSGKETVRMRANYFEVNGDILATGGTTFYGSDIRYKSIIHPVMLLALNKIAEAPSFVYRWNRPNMNQNRLNLGGSAQYTQSILPWAVDNSNNFLSMDYATVAYTFAVHTARHLLTYESRTDKKIKKLENRVKYLEKQLKKLGYEEVRTLDDQSV